MALKTYNPTTPGQRQLVIIDRSGLYKGPPVKALTEGQTSTGGRNNAGRITVALPRRRPQAGLSRHRLQARASSTCRRRSSGSNTIRTAPPSSRSIKYEDGELAYILAPQRLSPGDKVIAGRACRREAGQCHADRQYSGRHHRAQYRAQDRQGRADRALGRLLCADRRARPGLRHPAAEFRRAAAGAWPLHGDRRRGVEPRQHEHRRSARPAASAGGAACRTTAASP